MGSVHLSAISLSVAYSPPSFFITSHSIPFLHLEDKICCGGDSTQITTVPHCLMLSDRFLFLDPRLFIWIRCLIVGYHISNINLFLSTVGKMEQNTLSQALIKIFVLSCTVCDNRFSSLNLTSALKSICIFTLPYRWRTTEALAQCILRIV